VLTPEFTRQFVKDLKLMERRHKDIDKILDVMAMITPCRQSTGSITFPAITAAMPNVM
jgi:mRNA-degrading endonuclease YafQ of YafQ-DinJ toxin-antitoxin module